MLSQVITAAACISRDQTSFYLVDKRACSIVLVELRIYARKRKKKKKKQVLLSLQAYTSREFGTRQRLYFSSKHGLSNLAALQR